jgi:hypothetical protein
LEHGILTISLLFFINFYEFFEFFSSNIMGREKKWGGQLGVASLGWLQSPFFIVCLDQGHFFSNFSFINFYDFFKLFSSEYHGERGEGSYKNMKAQENL